MDWKDVVEFMIAGSSAIQIGTLNFIDPTAPMKIIAELEEYCLNSGLNKLSDITGSYII